MTGVRLMRLGRLLGVEFYLNPFFIALLCLFFVAGVLELGLICFGIVLVHEMAHVLVAKRMGLKVDNVELLPFGGVARIRNGLEINPVREIYVAAAGPASNLAMFFAGLALKNNGIWHESLGPFFLQSNLLLAIFNLLPALPLDGGRIYRALVAKRLGLGEATLRAAGLGRIISVFIFVAGVAGMLAGYCGLDIPLTAVFLFYASTRERAASPHLLLRLLRYKHEELKQQGLLPAMHFAVLENVPLGMLVKPFAPHRFHLVEVFDGSHKYLGTLTETEIINALLHRGAYVTAGELFKER